MGRHGSSVRTDMEMGRGHRHPWSIGGEGQGSGGGQWLVQDDTRGTGV